MVVVCARLLVIQAGTMDVTAEEALIKAVLVPCPLCLRRCVGGNI